MNPHFQPASPSDSSIVLELMHEFNALFEYEFDSDQAAHSLQMLLENKELGHIWLIQCENEVAGYMVLTLGFSFEYGGRDAFIDDIYLRPNYQGKGIGKQAIDYLKAIAIKLGVRALHLEVERDNSHAYKLYEKMGFVEGKRILMTNKL